MVSEVLAPWVLAAVLPVVVAALSTRPWWHGAALGALVAAFTSAIPAWLLGRAVRAGRASDRDVSDRRQRPAVLAAAAVSVAAGWVLAQVLHAGRPTMAMLVAMLAGAAVCAVISLVSKISLHVGAAAGSVAVLALVGGAWAWWLTAGVVAVAASRVVLGAHTVAQVVAGAVVGAGVAAGVMMLLE